ncbi:MAG TPA: TonB-dependent receptor plug domain-containing protein [Bacteroidales bacterium]|nr:TonB-dependent receptor plug domain-containing protein [Bacteroidales bacterium]
MNTKSIISVITCVLILVSGANGQKTSKKITITGSVINELKEPVSGATITLDNIPTRCVTDKKGNFKIKVSASAAKIGVYIPSAVPIEEPIDGRKIINLTISATAQKQINSEAASSGDETINQGYGTVKKKDLIQTVNKADGPGKSSSGYATIYDMLRTVPGVFVNGSSVRIQEAVTLYGSTEPLYVVDGIITSTISHISPSSVKSLEVLKGSAASIYGSRGANGVILITLINAADKE